MFDWDLEAPSESGVRSPTLEALFAGVFVEEVLVFFALCALPTTRDSIVVDLL